MSDAATSARSDGTEPADTDSSTPGTTSLPSRRAVLGAIAGLFGVSATGSALLAAGSAPAAAVEGDPAAFEAGDTPTVRSNDGRVEAVYLAPEVDVSWRNFGAGVRRVVVTVAVGSDAGVDVVYKEALTDADDAPGTVESLTLGEATDGFDAVDGDVAVAFERADATDAGEAVTGDRLSAPNLQAGEATATTLDVVLRADLEGRQGESETVVRTTAFDVAVRNPDGTADAGGQANTGAE